MNRVSSGLVLLVFAITASSISCAHKPDDAKISGVIESKFSQDSGLSGKQLTVQASQGVVTLAGFVDNDAQRAAAARQAASVDGVREVVNKLQVGQAAVKSAVKPSGAKPASVRATKKSHVSSTAEGPGQADRYYDISANTTAENSQPPVTAQLDSASANAAPATPPPAPPVPSSPPQPPKVTIEQGTQLAIRLIDSFDSEKNQVGDTFHASLNTALSAEGAEVIPAGTDVTGHIVDLKSAGQFKGQALLVLQLDAINSNGTTYNLQTDQYRKEGASRGKNTAEKVGGGAIVGGIIGAIAGGGKGAAIGSAAGAGVGGGAQAASKKQSVKLPSETVLNFTLQAPVTVIKQSSPNANRPKLTDSK
jgi:hypothetical protein